MQLLRNQAFGFNTQQENQIKISFCDKRPDQLKLPFAFWFHHNSQNPIRVNGLIAKPGGLLETVRRNRISAIKLDYVIIRRLENAAKR